jgi:glutamine cyclotransferase
MTDLIAVIDSASGDVRGWLDLSRLREHFSVANGWDIRENVPNGIAYDPGSKHLFVTGKRWPKVFEISLDP